MQLAGRLKNFIENWKILTNHTEIMSLVEGYTIPFYEISQQKNIPNSPKLRQEEDSSTEGNSRDVKQGSHCRDPKLLGSGIYQQLFSRREKG